MPSKFLNRGRKKGTPNGQLRKWQPKEWNATYEQIVIYSVVGGKSNKELGKTFGLDPVQISNILNTETGRLVKTRILEQVRSASVDDIKSRFTALQAKAIERIEKVVNNDELFERSPFAVFDRSMALLKSGGIIAGETPTPAPGVNVHVNNNTVQVPVETLERFSKALEKSNQASVLHTEKLSKDVGR